MVNARFGWIAGCYALIRRNVTEAERPSVIWRRAARKGTAKSVTWRFSW
jgi:hypothetical protein